MIAGSSMSARSDSATSQTMFQSRCPGARTIGCSG